VDEQGGVIVLQEIRRVHGLFSGHHVGLSIEVGIDVLCLSEFVGRLALPIHKQAISSAACGEHDKALVKASTFDVWSEGSTADASSFMSGDSTGTKAEGQLAVGVETDDLKDRG
jgi:hypothetical protein